MRDRKAGDPFLSPQSVSIYQQIVDTRGRSTGFDYLRVALAVGVVSWHTILVSYGSPAQEAAYRSHFRPLIALILPLFFALSGFLVAGSLERTPRLSQFLGLRALRIFPALAVETVLSALVVGPLLTIFSLSEYFRNKLLYVYTLNIIGIIHYNLPGVFASNPVDLVNGQLWTVPFELECYISLTVIAFLGVLARPWLLPISVFFISLLVMVAKLVYHHGVATVTVGPVSGYLLVATFLAGAYIHLMKRTVPHSPWVFGMAVIALVAGLSLPLGDCFVAFPAAYVAIYLGLLNPPANLLHRFGDLSYGIFLFGFPVQQIVADLGAPWALHWYWSLAIALPATCCVAYLSWNYVEKPTLSLRRYLHVLEPIDRLLERIRPGYRAIEHP